MRPPGAVAERRLGGVPNPAGGAHNAARHGAGQRRGRRRLRAERLEITVTNPVGPTERPGGGHGIVGMRERAALLGGTWRRADDGPSACAPGYPYRGS